MRRAATSLDTAKIRLDRAKRMLAESVGTQADLDAAQGAYDVAVADLAAARAGVAQINAQLKQTKTNLEYTKIISPIDGVVISRSIDSGQTVQASFQAPTLFVLAEDLRKMRVFADIDEADVGRVVDGLASEINVDAFPSVAFKGKVVQVRLTPVTQQGVVTYAAIIDVEKQISKSTSTEGNQVVTIKLTNTKPAAVAAINSDTKLGLAMKVEDLPKTAGGEIVASSKEVAAAPKNVTTVDGDSKPVGVASVTFPASVKAKDDTGAAINVANGVSVSVTKYSNNEASALAAFPGGFAPSVPAPSTAVSTGTTAETGAFISGGFAQFDVTDNATGKALKTFDKPLTLKIDLPKGSKDADGNAINTTTNNKYPIWSFDQASGKWVFETDGVVKEKTPVDPNNFEVEFTSTHLSYWNLDFYGSTCTGNLAITGRPTGDARPLTVEIVGTTGQRFYRGTTITDSQWTLNRYPQGTTA